MGKFSRLGSELYTGERSIDFVSKRLVWYLISVILVLGAAGIVAVKGVNLGIEFTGGTEFNVALSSDRVTQDTADDLRGFVSEQAGDAGDPIVTTSGSESILVQTEKLDNAESDELIAAIATELDIDPAAISSTEIGESLGAQLAQRALLGVLVFLLLVVLFIWAYSREWKMSVAGLLALFHDIAITVGVYALSGFPVTPAAVTGLLAILGFSLYDTVVVFDKVRENTKNLRQSRTTYAAAANLAVNQTLVRSINTAIVALIPIGAILYVSATQLGASSLQDLALSQFVGMGVGVYSSIFLAPRVLVHLKSSETDVKMADKRDKARRKAQADRYASVPNFVEDMPVTDDPDGDPDRDAGEFDDEEPRRAGGPVAPPRSSEAMGRGRTAPPAKGEVRQSNASGRQQPSRQPKSQRGKK
ncbi:MAG: protein translocase subunit SecF [Nocardioides sp.]